MPAGLCRGRCDRLPECRRGGETQTDVARLFGQLGALQLPRFNPLLCEQVPGGRHDGDWYGRGMYEEGGAAYKWHLEHYGHPSEFGFKDVINEWKAEKWNPEKIGRAHV